MRQIHRFLFLVALLSSSVAFGQITEDPEERRDQGQAPLKSQTPEGNPLPFKDRIRFGGGISGLSFGNPFSIGLSPVVAYQVSEHFVAGLGVGYTYSSGYRDFNNAKIDGTLNQYSGRVFGMYEILPAIIPNIYAHVELDQRSYSTKGQLSVGGLTTGSSTATWLGATYSQPIGRLFSANLSALYNVSYSSSLNDQILYGSSPFTIRILFF
ncbi:hypothetical protein [Fibrivirga algicola]|uniref:Outer membrane protein beta-barrel domain-containing protein n=1 Tax=Fibrivirga algicola TaxID=2950420 RepID=A0ABX0QJD8_9BACT|nr:hypothetical protein [Fibrivirga algicola]ARK09843.1 hypothetical protein A6C57_05535 [Fibrella sp. ES10-3-2-2]NID10758.1 hypothetical protein [Fibrivirga algicola]